MKEMWVVTYIYHLSVNLSTPNMVVCVRGCQANS